MSNISCRPSAPGRGPIGRALATALVALSSSAAAPSVELEDWSRLDTPSFTFFSNAADDRTERHAAELETFRGFVAKQLGDGVVESPLPTHVYLFDHDFEDFSLGAGNVGWFTSSRQANIIAVDSSSRAGTEIAYHEYVHFVVENSTPAVPLWLNEGLAEFYSTFAASEDGVEFGRPVDRHVDFLRRNRLISFDDLFAVTRDSPEYTEEDRRGVFYAQSWAFVHYLLVGQNEFRVEVDDFLDRLRDGEPADEAYEEAFGTSTIGLRSDLEHYVGGATFEYLRVPGLRLTAAGPGRPEALGAAEASARLGLLRLAGRVGDPDDAARDFDRALDLDETNATGTRGIGEVALLRGDFDQAATWFEWALLQSPSDPAILDLHGLALLQRVEVEQGGPEGRPPRRDLIDRARTSFARAIAAEPNYAPALSGYGRTFFWDPDPSEGIEVSARAVRLLPRNPVILTTHLALVAQAGDLAQAERVYDWLRRPAVRPTERNLEDAERALFNAEFQHLTRLFGEPSGYPQLLAGLEELILEAPSARLQVELQGQIDQLREVVERNRWADTYNRALELLESGEQRAGYELLERVADESSDLEIAAEAERTLGRVAIGSNRRR